MNLWLKTLRQPHPSLAIRSVLSAVLLMLSMISVSCLADSNPYRTARNRVTQQTCLQNETVDQWLNHKLRPSHRDLGWRVFKEEVGYIVERAFLVSKSMEIRYRWHVDEQGAIFPDNSRAENLCL